jgi:hypothetical protein
MQRFPDIPTGRYAQFGYPATDQLNPPPKKEKEFRVTDDMGYPARNDKWKQEILNEYPAFKKMGDITFKADPFFTREQTGVGDIEYMNPKQDYVRYTENQDGPNDYWLKHPKPGSHAIVYNPETNNKQNIIMDMFHGQAQPGVDPEFLKHKESVKQVAMKDPDQIEKMGRQWKFFESRGWTAEDKPEWEGHYIDSLFRNMYFKGTPEEFKRNRYNKEAQEKMLSNPEYGVPFTQQMNHLKYPGGAMLPQATVTANRKNNNGVFPIPPKTR